MDSSYWVAAYSALAYTKQVVKEKKKGSLTFVSSVMGYMSFIAYSTYYPAKHALRETEEGQTSEQVALGLLKGVQNGYFHITSDMPGNIFCSSTRGATPGNNIVLD
ncbi:3-dehydrosphinganine reductase [Marasmius sp. AFHP31]|nr:3-dehydrosphinganine reductase [Marasmius sp. AFHP31]